VVIDVVKLRKRGSGLGYYSYEVTLPKEFVEKLGRQPGDRILVRLEGPRIILEKAEIRPSSQS
jgi:antitoxin component of MazEF toxin-antitoxin module